MKNINDYLLHSSICALLIFAFVGSLSSGINKRRLSKPFLKKRMRIFLFKKNKCESEKLELGQSKSRCTLPNEVGISNPTNDRVQDKKM